MAALPQLIEEDIDQLNAVLSDLLTQSEAAGGLVIDKGGFLITQCGALQSFDTTTLAALSAAAYAATQTIAGLVSETNFSCVYQQGEQHSVLIQNVDENCLLLVIFKASASVGAVKYFAAPAILKAAEQLRIAERRDPSAKLDLSTLNVADTSSLFRKRVA
ncbi:MAG: roadblock/LC7 domain-containing protein [Verrucomicrobia bacterium]|nr:roadblock/LC7 domain-containing protein [Verrucomicrobiota bacterium]